jgi:hypothetical protein
MQHTDSAPIAARADISVVAEAAPATGPTITKTPSSVELVDEEGVTLTVALALNVLVWLGVTLTVVVFEVVELIDQLGEGDTEVEGVEEKELELLVEAWRVCGAETEIVLEADCNILAVHE